jgi:hypothetical protein
VFFATVGWAVGPFGAGTVAVAGRAAVWLALALALARLGRAVGLKGRFLVAGAALGLAASLTLHLAGEWIVGGFEAKGFAYAAAIAAVASAMERRWTAAGTWLGVAAAWHVLVGAWAATGLLVAWRCVGPERPAFHELLPGAGVALLLSLAGIVPALAVGGSTAAEAAAAAQIYVVERLPHHLYLPRIRPDFQRRFAALVIVWGALAFTARSREQRLLHGVAAGALALALVGGALGMLHAAGVAPGACVRLLRVYWFRSADVMVPLVAALDLAWRAQHARRATWAWVGLVGLVAALVAWQPGEFAAVRGWNLRPRAEKPGKVLDYEAWQDVCQWVNEHTPREALFLTPRSNQTFKWRAERAEVATWKDVPQDAAGLIAWRARIEDLYWIAEEERMAETAADLPVERVREQAERYRAQYVIADVEPELPLKRAYSNDRYVVYASGVAGTGDD